MHFHRILPSLAHLKRVAGPRTVPVEIGSRYTDEGWSQKLMTMADFIDSFVSPEVQLGLVISPCCNYLRKTGLIFECNFAIQRYVIMFQRAKFLLMLFSSYQGVLHRTTRN